MNTLSEYLSNISSIKSTYLKKLESKIDRSKLLNYIDKEQNEIKEFLKDEKIRYSFDKKNYNLKIVFERESESYDSRRLIKKFVAHVFLSHELFSNIFNQIEIELVRQLKKHNISRSNDPGKLRALLNYLRLVTEEYGHYISSYRIIAFNLYRDKLKIPAWKVEIPTPDPLFCLIDELFYLHHNGILASSLIRTYFEIKFYPWLQNILSNEYKKKRTTKQKLIRFNREFGIKDFRYWANYLNILDDANLDLLERFYQYGSATVHIGTFFDRVIAHKTLYYLQELTLSNCAAFPKSFRREVKKSIENKKFMIINDNPIERYNYFQSPSNKRISVSKGFKRKFQE